MPPRPLRPKDELTVPDSSEVMPDAKLTKRRAISSACVPCRKRKSKCDGNLPSCSTCIAVYRTECFYDESGEQRRKSTTKKDPQALCQQNDALDVIVASLKGLPEHEALALLQSLRAGSSPDGLAASLRADVRMPHGSSSQILDSDLSPRMSSSVPNSQSLDGTSFSPSRSCEHSTSEPSIDAAQNYTQPFWSRTPQDPDFVEHLLSLYFTWIHPFYHFFSRDHFLHDMGQGRTEYCSAMLVNAIMAFACHYSDRPGARSDTHDSATAGDPFFFEAKRLLELSDKSCLTTIQALLIMSCRECSQGRESSGYQLLGRAVRMGLELGLHLSVISSGLRSHEVEIRKITFWGMFSLENTCALGYGRVSQLPRVATDISKPIINDRKESQTWRPYEDANMATSPSAQQPARTMLFVDQYSRLCEITSDMTNTFYAPQERLTSEKLVMQYSQFQDWYRNLPDAFRLENSSLPYVLVLHMVYYSCVLQPYIKCDLRSVNLYPVEIATYCANEISSLMNALRAMYGLRRVALPVPNMLLAAATIHLLNLPSEPAASHLTQGLHDLHAMAVNHRFAAQCVDIIHSLAVKWNITLPDGAAAALVFRGAHPPPMSPPHNSTFFAATIPRTNSSDVGTQSNSTGSHQSPFPPPPTSDQRLPFSRSYSDPTVLLDVDQLQHPFWTPFPAQGMPLNQLSSFHTFDNRYLSLNAPQQWHMPHGLSPNDKTSNDMDDNGSSGLSAGNWTWQ